MKSRGEFLRGQLLDGVAACVRFARGENDLCAATGELTADFKADAAIAAGDDDYWSWFIRQLKGWPISQ
jgi:hypothetical protein